MMMRTEKKQEQKVLATLNALNQLYHTLKYTDKVSISSISKEHSIAESLSKILKDGKIITSNGKQAVAARYKWASIKPNLHMAKEVDSKIRAYSSSVNKKSYDKKMKKTTSKYNVDRDSIVSKAKRTIKEIPAVENKIINNLKTHKLVSSETKYLFGLIKIKTKYTYKN